MLFAPALSGFRSSSAGPSLPLELRKLDLLCYEYDAICRFLSSVEDHARSVLIKFGEQLWKLARQICAEIAVRTEDPGLEQPLRAFRRTVFAERVVRWHRLSPQVEQAQRPGAAGLAEAARGLVENAPERLGLGLVQDGPCVLGAAVFFQAGKPSWGLRFSARNPVCEQPTM
jgi:hypothetical protein